MSETGDWFGDSGQACVGDWGLVFVAPDGTPYLGPVLPWDAEQVYAQGNLVNVGDGSVYYAIVGNLGQDPLTTPLVWQIIAGGGGGGGGLPAGGDIGDIITNSSPGNGVWQSVAAAGIATAAALTAEQSARVSGDATTLASGKTYADGKVAAEAALRVSGDAASVATAATDATAKVAAEAGLRTAADALLIPLTQKGAASGVATLDGTSKIPSSQIPAIAITEFLGTTANQAAMLALVGQSGDWTIRSDDGLTYVITGPDPSQLSDWTALSYPGVPVASVNGQTGVVSLDFTDVGADAAGSAAAAQAAAIAASQPLDSDLTAIAALATTAYGRALLTEANAVSIRATLGLGSASLSASTAFQPTDADLTSIAALTTTAYGRAFLTLANQAALLALIPDATATVRGLVPNPPNDVTKFYRGDGTFAVPAGGGAATYTGTGVPAGGTGVNGDIYYRRSVSAGATLTEVWLKIAGTWVSQGALALTAAAQFMDSGGINIGPAPVGLPTSYLIDATGSALPTAAQGFSFVGTNLSYDAPTFSIKATALSINSAQSRAGAAKYTTSGAFGVVEALVTAETTVGVLPTETNGYAGCGQLGASSPVVVTDKNGVMSLGNMAVTSYSPVVSSAAGTVLANDVLAFERRGALVFGRCLRGGALVAELVAPLSYFGAGAAYGTGAAPYVFRNTTVARLNFASGIY